MDNEREKRFAVYILEALQELNEAAEDAKAVPTQRSLIAAIVSELNEYRAELRPEPTAGDRKEAEALLRSLGFKSDEYLAGGFWKEDVAKIAAALSAAREKGYEKGVKLYKAPAKDLQKHLNDYVGMYNEKTAKAKALEDAAREVVDATHALKWVLLQYPHDPELWKRFGAALDALAAQLEVKA